MQGLETLAKKALIFSCVKPLGVLKTTRVFKNDLSCKDKVLRYRLKYYRHTSDEQKLVTATYWTYRQKTEWSSKISNSVLLCSETVVHQPSLVENVLQHRAGISKPHKDCLMPPFSSTIFLFCRRRTDTRQKKCLQMDEKWTVLRRTLFGDFHWTVGRDKAVQTDGLIQSVQRLPVWPHN